MKNLPITIIFILCSINLAQAQNNQPKFQTIVMQGYTINIPNTWMVTDNFDPIISDFKLVATNGNNGILEITPIPDIETTKLTTNILNNRLYLKNKQLATTNKEKSRALKSNEIAIANIIENENNGEIEGELSIFEHDNNYYALMYYGTKPFCKSKELKQTLKSFTLTDILPLDPDAGLTDSIKAMIPVAINMDDYKQNNDGWYQYNKSRISFAFPNNWIVERDDVKSDILTFASGNEDDYSSITIMASPFPLKSESAIDSMIVQRQSETEIFKSKETGKIGTSKTINYPFIFILKDSDNSEMNGEIILFDNNSIYFYIICISPNEIQKDEIFAKIFNSFEIDETENEE